METGDAAPTAKGGADAGTGNDGAAAAGSAEAASAGANGVRAPEEPATCRVENPGRVVPAQVRLPLGVCHRSV